MYEDQIQADRTVICEQGFYFDFQLRTARSSLNNGVGAMMTLHVVRNQAELQSSQLPALGKLHPSANNLLTINCLGERECVCEAIMAAKVVKDAGFQSNMEVDYVISYRFATTGVFFHTEKGRQHTDIVWADRTAAKANFEKLVQALASVGLATEVRNGGKHSLLVFVKVASEEYLFGEVYRSRYGFFFATATAFCL